MSMVLKDISDELLPLFAQVTFRDKPLSHYLLNTEAGGKKPGTHPEDEGQHMAGSSQEALTTGLLFLSADMPNPSLSSTYILSDISFRATPTNREGRQAVTEAWLFLCQ